MAVAEADRLRVGPLGLEGQHVLGTVRLNTPLEAGFPRYKLDRIPGLRALAEGDDNRESRMGQLGERTHPSLLRGKSFSYEGRVQALTLADLRVASDELLYAVADRRLEQDWRIEPHPDNPLGRAVQFRARVLEADIPEEQTRDNTAQPSPWQREFTLGLRMADPRFYEVAEQVATGAGPVAVPNPGSAPTDPLILVDGPAAAGWTLYGAGSRVLYTAGLALADGETAAVDFAQRLVLRDGADVTGIVTPASNWWDEGVYGIDPRSDTAINVGGAAGLEVRWRVAYF